MTNTSGFLHQYQGKRQGTETRPALPCLALMNPVQLTPRRAGGAPPMPGKEGGCGEWNGVVGNGMGLWGMGNRGNPFAGRYRKADIRRHHLVLTSWLALCMRLGAVLGRADMA